jgi:glycosyltransferase involved in cell wall biosynthesis
MGTNNKTHLLFAAFMAGGNATILQNLQNVIEPKEDVSSSWLRIDMDPKRLTSFGEKRSFLIPGTFRNSFVTFKKIREIEKRSVNIDAAYFFQHTICMGLVNFRRRVPYVIAMDNTPMFCAKNGLWYAHPYFDPKSLGAKLKHILTRDVYDQAFHLLPISTKVRDSLINDYRITPQKISVVPPGIDVNKFSFLDRRVEHCSEKPLNIIFVGADFIRKGGDLLVAVAAQEEFKDTEFHFVTKSYCGPRLNNIFVHDNISPNTESMVKLLHNADIFVLPTRADTFSIASLEAMATGLPVITVAVGGIKDIVDQERTGYFVLSEDVKSLIDRIRNLRDNVQLRYEMGFNGRRKVERTFNSKIVGEAVVSLLLSAVAQKPIEQRRRRVKEVAISMMAL